MTWELPPKTERASAGYAPMDVRLQMLMPDIQTLVRKLIVLADLAASAMSASGQDREAGLEAKEPRND